VTQPVRASPIPGTRDSVPSIHTGRRAYPTSPPSSPDHVRCTALDGADRVNGGPDLHRTSTGSTKSPCYAS